jgi:hypothetical protein
MFSISTLSTILNSSFVSFFSQHFCFLLLLSSMFTSLCFFLHYYSLKFFDHALHTHAFANFRVSKKHTISFNKQKQFMTLLHLFSSLSFPPIPFIFWPYRCLLINASSLKLWRPVTTICCVLCITTWEHVISSLWMNTPNLTFWLLCIHSPPRLVVLTPHHFPCTFLLTCRYICWLCQYTYWLCQFTCWLFQYIYWLY